MRSWVWLTVLLNLISGVSPIAVGTRSFVVQSFASGDVERSSRNGGKLRATPFSTLNRFFLARKTFSSKHLASFFMHLSRRIKRKATVPTVFPIYLLPKSGRHGKVCSIYSQLACNTRLIRSVLHQNRVTGQLSQFFHRVISTLYFLHRSATVAFKRLSFASTFLSQTRVAAIDIFRWTANSLSQHERKGGGGREENTAVICVVELTFAC